MISKVFSVISRWIPRSLSQGLEGSSDTDRSVKDQLIVRVHANNAWSQSKAEPLRRVVRLRFGGCEGNKSATSISSDAGGILILATIIGAVGFNPTVLIGAIAAVIGGTVV